MFSLPVFSPFSLSYYFFLAKYVTLFNWSTCVARRPITLGGLVTSGVGLQAKQGMMH